MTSSRIWCAFSHTSASYWDGEVSRPLALIDADQTVEAAGRPGLLLGAFDDGYWQDTSFTVAPGATLLLYTDGVTDTVGPGRDRYGPHRLHDHLRCNRSQSAPGIVAALTGDLARFQVGAQADDTAMLAIRRLEARQQPAAGSATAPAESTAENPRDAVESSRSQAAGRAAA